MKSTVKIVIAACVLAVVATGASAGLITYVDHTWEGNSISDLNVQGPSNDGFWDLRGYANDGTIFQNAGTGAVDDAHRMRTIVSGLPALEEGLEYEVFAYFWSDTSNTWNLRASLENTATDYPLYDPGTAGVVPAVASDFDSAVMVSEGNRTMYQISLGFVDTTAITVYVDDKGPEQVDYNERTWYDGIGYRIVPEPGTFALCAIGLGLVSLVRRRR